MSTLGVMIEVTKDNKILNKNAHQKPSTLKPSTNLLPSRMITALITNRKRPRVKIVIGSVSKTRMGFNKVLKMARTIANTIAVHIESI